MFVVLLLSDRLSPPCGLEDIANALERISIGLEKKDAAWCGTSQTCGHAFNMFFNITEPPPNSVNTSSSRQYNISSNVSFSCINSNSLTYCHADSPIQFFMARLS